MKTTDKYIFFWKAKDIYSNWHPAKFEYDGEIFENSEAAFMYYKAITFNDEIVAANILRNQDPRTVKDFGRKVSGFDKKYWDDIKFDAMYEVCLQKFKQNKELKQQLLATGNRKFVEASPTDMDWGIGLDENSSYIHDEKNWKGKNLLGKVLDKVKETLKK